MDRYSQLSSRAADFVRDQSAVGPVLVLAANRSAAEEVARAACGAALLGVRALSLRDLVMELAVSELNRRALVPVGRFVREALAARVTAEAIGRGELEYLAPVASFPGFPRALTDTFEELRLNAIAPDGLRECGRSGADLARLLAAYTAELTERRFADHALRVVLAREAPPPDSAVVTLDLAPRTSLERELLDRLRRPARAALDLRLDPPGEELVRAAPGSVDVFSTSGEALECVEIARRIHAAAREGVPFDQVGILLRSPERHQPMVAEALRRAGIPVQFTRGTLRPDAAGRAFLALLECAEEGLSASRFAEYLSLGQMPEGEEEAATPALWERLLVDAAVIGGPERWQRRLAGLREELHRRHRDEADEAGRAVWERKIAAVENLKRLALPVIARLAALPARALWGAWIGELVGLAESTLRDPGRLVELLEELEPMSDIGPVTLAEVMLVLAPRLNALRAAPRESRYGKVWVGAIEEARGLSFRRVFLPGVNEGLFPRPAAEDPLLVESQRHQLGIELRTEETELLRVAMACASERIALSFSRLDLLTGRERVPSFYAFAAWRASGGGDLDVREFERRARAATGTRIGWPSPADPAEAIDDAEFDLAALAPLTPGAGQYLKKLPGRAVDSLRARWVRWHKPWKAADGLLFEEIGSGALERYRLGVRAWSPTALQQYARCPYRFALYGIHGLRPAERPGGIQRMDPATRGRIYHEAQFELLRGLEAAGGLPVTPDNLPAALERLDAALYAVAAKAQEELAPAIPQIWKSELEGLRADLRGWLRQKASLDPDWTPAFFELSFGLNDPAGRDPRSRPEPVEVAGGFRLQGSIDLVERHRSGAVRVVDHKTGRVPDPKPEMVGSGEVLQPALYALAAEKILGEPVTSGRLYYATIAQNYTPLDVPLHDWTRARAKQVLHAIDGAIRDGMLPAAPRKDGCKRCEYLPVCGPYEEERAREAKSQPELKGLKELRGWR